ncbi:MAG: AAA family ATPase [Bacillota bacterium]
MSLNDILPHQTAKVQPKAIPRELKKYPHWVCWRWQKRGDKPTKPPYNPLTDTLANVSDPRTWGTFEDALSVYETGGFDGVGFVLTTDDPYCAVDLDDCYNPETGKLSPTAQRIVGLLQSYTEISPSGKGLRIVIKGKLPEGGRKAGKIELYDTGRYVTVTGHTISEPQGISVRQTEVERLHAELFDPDYSLIEQIATGQRGEKLKQLWCGDTGNYPSHSEADLALCTLLAKIVGNDSKLIDKLFRKSELFREKWDIKHFGDGKTYGEATIEKALASGKPTNSETHSPLIVIPGPKFIETAQLNPPTWFLQPLIGSGLVSLLAGKQREAGKSTLVAHLLRSLTMDTRECVTINGREFDFGFLGFQIVECPATVLLVTEEPPHVWATRPELNWTRIEVIDDFSTLAAQWDKFSTEAAKGRWDLIVLDSLDNLLAASGVESENEAMAITNVMNRILILARRHQIAWLILDHLRKSADTGDLGEVRGSGAKGGRADVILTLTTQKGQPRRRVLRGWSRLPLPPVLMESGLIIELDEEGHYTDIGSKRGIQEEDQMDELTTFIKEFMPPEGGTIKNVVAASGLKPDTVRKRLTRALKFGLVERPQRGVYRPFIGNGTESI